MILVVSSRSLSIALQQNLPPVELRVGLQSMWLHATKRAAREAWEKILLDELFLFSGGLEGAWSSDAGWTKTVPRGTSHRENGHPRAGVFSRDGRVSSDDADLLQILVLVDISSIFVCGCS